MKLHLCESHLAPKITEVSKKEEIYQLNLTD